VQFNVKDDMQINHKLKIDPRIVAKFPEYAAFVIYAAGIENRPSDQYSTGLLQDAERKQREAFGTEKPSSHPHIAAWREAYKRFGSKPNKYLCSIEALLSRTLKGQNLPAINWLVDLYNEVSIRHILPVGGEDWDYLTSDLILTLATGEEPFVTFEHGEEIVTHPDPDEVIWADSTGVTCRKWNWRQCRRTALTVDTRNAYFVLDCLSPYTMEALIAAGEELIEHLKKSSLNCTISYEILNAENTG
jgi:DNA/RNA-binding domain of Phe-tRNA-synthetase-like protein